MSNAAHRLLSKRIAMKMARRQKEAPKHDDLLRSETNQVLRQMKMFLNAK